MANLFDQIVGQRGGLENLLARIPGFRGYQEKNQRREADRMLRDHIADQLTQRINRLIEIERDLLDRTGFTYMSKTQSAKTKLQTYRDRVRGAAPGYSGFMETIKVDEESLARIYSFDEAQLRYADQFDAALNTLSDAATRNEGVEDAIRALDHITVEANEAFALREDVLTNISKSV